MTDEAMPGLGAETPLGQILTLFTPPDPYGTIGPMKDHRVRLVTEDIGLIVSALKARAAMCRGMRRHRVERLAARLAELSRGNPKFSLGDLEQTHEDQLDEDELIEDV